MALWFNLEEDPSAFLVSFPTYRLHSKPRSILNGLWVFSSSKDEGSENNSYTSDNFGTPIIIYDQIESVFSKINDHGFEIMAQFWAPVTIGGKHLLSTSGQPFAASCNNPPLQKYRRLRVEHMYDIDVNSNNSKFRGSPASAFLNRFPEIVSMDPNVYHEVDPLLRNAFQECFFRNSVMIPICCPSQTSSSSDCIGVIECSSWFAVNVKLFNEINMEIKEAGLGVYNVQDRIPYKTINGLELARGQIQEVLKIVCQSHHINLAQVWIASLDENHVHFSSSWEEAQTRRPLGLKLTGYNNIDADPARKNCWIFQNYYDACDLIPLQPVAEFVLKTLQDYEPRLCKNISKLRNYKHMPWGLIPVDGIRSLTICMRSIDTGDFNYVFEFLWINNPSYPILLEEILLNIKRCLPSFKFASGTEIGDKLHVIDVDNSTDKEIKKFDIFHLKRLSPIPEALKEGNKQVAVDYMVLLDTNCKTTPVHIPQQVIEQQFGTSTTENFLDLVADRDDERLSEATNKGKKAMVVDYNARSKEKRGLSREDIEQHYENNSYSLDDVGTRMMIYDKIKSAFSKVDNRYGFIAQFWAPVIIGGKHLLLTSGQPFAVSYLGSSFKKYRRLRVEHVYDIDVNSNITKFRGTPASAFLNRFPEMAYMHTSVHHEVDPFLRNAFQECSLTTSFMIPIRCPSETSSSSDCIGVIECTSWIPKVKLFKNMNKTIQEVGLSVYNVQDRIPYKTINGLKLATDQIQVALKIVCQSHQIPLAQVWIASLDENHVHFSSSWEEAQTRRLLGLKLTGYKSIDEDSARRWSFPDYYDACDMIPLHQGDELVLKTLQDYEPRFCKNISQLGTYMLMGWGSLGDKGNRCLTICMRSFHTGDFNYVFEFFWKHNSFYPISLEEILLNIKKCLPSFKFASGTEIGDKLRVEEIVASSKKIKNFNIFRLKKLSPIPEAFKGGKKQVAVDYIGVPLDTNCKTAPVLIPQQVIEQQIGTSTTENFHENIFGYGNLMTDRDDERLSEFLETLPTYILHKKPETEGALWVFCSKDGGSQNNFSLDDLGTRMIYDKIKSAFSKVNNGGELIVQFWAPVTSGNRRVLSTLGQPFGVSDFGEALVEYRGRCMGYECNIDMNNNMVIKDEIEQHGDHRPMTMVSGPPTNVFLNRLPEAVLDTKNHREGSLMRYASDCGLWTSYTLPIGCPSQYYSSCIGVVECSSISSINLEVVNTMKRALEQEDLNVFNVQDRIPYNTINGLKLVRDEIQVALKIVCESHKIGVAQVWISYEDENHVPISFSSEDIQTTHRLALKLTGYTCVNEDSTACHWCFKEYYEACDMVPLKIGEELVEKTLEDYQPRFCENISQLDTNMLMAWVSTDDVACSGFTICLSIDSGDFSCAFEFIWHHNPNYVLLLEALLLTLKRHLPRFNFASGAELGDQLDVIDVDNSTESETKFFKIFKEIRLSPIPEAIDKGKKAMVNYNPLSKEKRDTTEIELSREDIEQHYGKTMKKAAEELGVSLSTLKRKHNKLGMSGWQGPDLPQRKAYKSNKNQSEESHTHEKDNGVIQDPSPVKRNENTVIKAVYADDIIKLHLRISEATFVTVENEIGKKFKLKHGTFKIKYLDEDEEWILMTSDQDLSDCIQNSRRLRVLLHNQ